MRERERQERNYGRDCGRKKT